ncbi:MAG: sulfite exporter TauE/SafE family protein [Burkholderiales bacterium]|nr:sulfite exporter TauE/SafE family protein [Burkholderiales bacterium]
MEFAYVIAGLVVGFVVGLTGVGGGSLMTPILLWFGIHPTAAVGTDLLYAAITKSGGVMVHQRAHNIDWRLTGWLALASVPTTIATVVAIHLWHPDTHTLDNIMRHALGAALLLTSVAILLRGKLISWRQASLAQSTEHADVARVRVVCQTLLVGALLGVIVTLSSIGAGALGTLALFLLYPTMPTSRLIGTEIAHAVPLTLIAGLGHAGLGHVDWLLLLKLLCGSLPGIWIGSHLTGKLSDRALRPALAGMLAFAGARLVY